MAEILPAMVQQVRQQCGLDMRTLAWQAQKAVVQRMQATSCAHQREYLALLQSDDEMKRLVELLVVPETWFFRYPESFDVLCEHSATQKQGVDILSLPCSTGEEPYSIVMALLMKGMLHRNIRVDAADISHDALKRAQVAHYYAHSFRQEWRDFRERYFDCGFDTHVQQQYWILQNHVRQCVRFFQANLLQDCTKLKPQYDMIFCRNLLIYFDKDTQSKALEVLYGMLKPDGLLFLGHAGSNHMDLMRKFRCVSHRAFVWKKTAVVQEVQPKPVLKRAQPMRHPARHSRKVQTTRASALPTPASVQAEPSLEMIERLANQGKLQEAGQQCRAYTQANPAQAQGWYLLGVLMQAENRWEHAKTYFQKALYLSPNHQHSLIQLAGMMEAEGLYEQANRLRQRVRMEDMV